MNTMIVIGVAIVLLIELLILTLLVIHVLRALLDAGYRGAGK
ncbi:hypothetical protein [Sagittula salina]|nr:hypothetical protein [Sagittula salina]